ncbi:puratrophin-1-like [Polyodon spathula]|uniref:puratrophin-1-like n=1 Tax=Polyodon spathula TaxID=7913 RepID=UPI001B7DCA3A|nr:puratrophin-1-like [Polyodon spathula]
MQERVFMGIGSKPFIDIEHSEAAISDRAINCIPAGKECKTLPPAILPASYEHLLSQRPNSIGSGSSVSSSGSHSSSSSGRGSLPPHGYHYSQSRQGEASRGFYRALGGLEEDELDNEAEPLHLLLDSSESSGESISGFSSSDNSCLSVVGGEAEETSSVSSLCSKPSSSPEPQHDLIRRAPPLYYKPRSFSATSPEAKTAAQHAGTNKPDGALSGHSTEV